MRQQSKSDNNSGISVCEEKILGCQVTTVEIQSKEVAEQLKRGVGRYITIRTSTPLEVGIKISEAGECLALMLDRLLRPYYQGKLCICGFGNWKVAADSLGPEVVQALSLKLFSQIGLQGNFRDVCAFAPGTEMSNNVRSDIIAGGVIGAVGADCVLLIDSLVAQNTDTLFQSFQLSTSGELNLYTSSQRVDWSALGVPVISLGVPVTISSSTFFPKKSQEHMMLTSVNISDNISAATTIISYAILRVCYPALTKEECFAYAKASRDPIPYFESSD